MIEVKYDDVGFTAINARMFEQVGDETLEIFGVIARGIPMSVGDVRGAITFVVGPVPGLVARAAEAVEASCHAILEGEFGY